MHRPAEGHESLGASVRNHRDQGLRTNRDFLVATLRTPEFLAGDTTTDFIERVEPTRVREISRQEQVEAAIAVAMESQAQRRANSRVLRSLPSGWRNSTMPMEAISFHCGDEVIDVAYRLQRDGRFRLYVMTTNTSSAPTNAAAVLSI